MSFSEGFENMIQETGFNSLTERDNFIVVYPFITSYDGLRNTNCWGFFLDQHIHEDSGEVEDLHQIAPEIEAAFKIDSNRRYVTGLLSGAGMSVPLAVARNEYFAAAGSVARLPYSETAAAFDGALRRQARRHAWQRELLQSR